MPVVPTEGHPQYQCPIPGQGCCTRRCAYNPGNHTHGSLSATAPTYRAAPPRGYPGGDTGRSQLRRFRLGAHLFAPVPKMRRPQGVPPGTLRPCYPNRYTLGCKNPVKMPFPFDFGSQLRPSWEGQKRPLRGVWGPPPGVFLSDAGFWPSNPALLVDAQVRLRATTRSLAVYAV